MSSIAACNSSAFDFNIYSWPPSDTIPITRFMSSDSCIGQPLVMKKFRDKNPLHESDWSEDILASKEAQRLAILFNSELNSNKPIRFIAPYIDECRNNIWPPFIGGEKILAEPYLGKNVYKKFNLNSGWEDKNCRLSTGAFSHFIYRITSGTNLVCDLQGIKNNNEYILTDPVICSIKNSL
ncbi:unnamed protein product [Rotaria magnacalcarata]|uniref:Alpha-type protein kinase domain-containing protein n=1 Tax=Rotaria magnacalcarata TaxID=392030 RepID=A0A816YZ15_9BILA|nr:unnamed protein product [Rotaria magnacalcarata]